MPLQLVEIMVKSEVDGPQVVQRVKSLSENSPFALHGVEMTGPHVWTCTFIISRPELVVGFRSVAELLSRIAFEFEVYRVERFEGPV
jgi:hypothetical protein